MKYSEVTAYFTGKALKYMREHPKRVLGLMAIKTALFWGPLEVTDSKVIHYDRQNCAVLRYSPGFSVFLTLCIVGSCLAFFDLRAARKSEDTTPSKAVRQIEICVLIFLFVAAYFLSVLPFMASARYRVPIIPFVLLFGAYAIYRAGKFIQSHDWRRLAVCVFVGVGLYLQVSKPVFAYKPLQEKWHMYRGRAYHHSGKLDQAVAEYRKAIQLYPNFYQVHINLSTVLSKQNKYNEAVVPARDAVRVRPYSAEAHVILGAALCKTSRLDEGMEHLAKAVNLAPDYFDAHCNLAVAWVRKREIDKAVEHLERARQLQPNNPVVRGMLAKLLAAQGRTEEAIQEFREVLRLNPADTEAQYLLGVLISGQKIDE